MLFAFFFIGQENLLPLDQLDGVGKRDNHPTHENVVGRKINTPLHFVLMLGKKAVAFLFEKEMIFNETPPFGAKGQMVQKKRAKPF